MKFNKLLLSQVSSVGSEYFSNLHTSNGLDFYAYGRLIQRCSERRLPLQTKQVHARLILSSIVPDNFIASKLINAYFKTNHIREARQVFDSIPHKNTFSWNSILIGYSSNNMHIDALWFFSLWLSRPSENNKPDNFTITCLLKALSSLFSDVNLAKMIHCFVMQNGFGYDIFVMNALVTNYASCGDIHSARNLFDVMLHRDIVTWNSMISGYSQGGYYQDCKELYKKMIMEDWKPDGITVVCVLQSCAQTSDLEFGIGVHQYVIDNHIDMEISIYNALISLYTKCNKLDYAKKLVDDMTEKDEVTYGAVVSGYMIHGHIDTALNFFREIKSPGLSTWNSMIAGLMQNNHHDGVPELFREMQVFGLRPNSITVSSILPSLVYFSNLKGAKEVHAYTIRSNFDMNVYVVTGTIDTYGKLGFLQGARRVFDQSSVRSVIVWTSIIAAYAVHGDSDSAISLFREMISKGTNPDSVTFISVLSACAHSGAVREGWEIFNSMVPKYGMIPSIEHYACMVGVLSRAGKLSEAVELISNMGMEPSAKVWGAIFNGASVYGNVEVGKFVFDRLVVIEPENSGNYAIMANLFKLARRWDEAERVRGMMDLIGLKKIAGCSWIEMNGRLHKFIAKDKSNEKAEEIYEMLDVLLGLMKEEGYVLIDDAYDEESVV
ncbi:pentatricopeptide repeat-containing protein At2g37310 [Impatiens glandulifera]|uniref:pentatricopeptide repeat-containing protein At2g37310 n=1 Tax=Impatiens glandulifera TaxID=253017 RepID=UPI001FB0B27A|nr:pentatricopeptide repeat-containing protein At2g37310 [Impatiens glandulifera]